MNAKQISYMVDNLRDQFKALKLLDTILNRFNDIPASRVEWIRNELLDLFKVDVYNMSFDEINKLQSDTDKYIKEKKSELMNVENFYHGKAVIEKLTNKKEFENFIRGWRIHFLKSMKPKFMPVGWSVNFTFSREIDRRQQADQLK